MPVFQIADYNVLRINGFHSLKDTLRRIVIHYSMSRLSVSHPPSLKNHSLQDLIQDTDHPMAIDQIEPWTVLEEADFSFNSLEEIDESVRLLGSIQKFNLGHNRLKDIGFSVQHLTHLVELDLTHNSIINVEKWNEKLGNLKKLILSGNRITSLEGGLVILSVVENRRRTRFLLFWRLFKKEKDL